MSRMARAVMPWPNPVLPESKQRHGAPDEVRE
jgi:hypothetical protein